MIEILYAMLAGAGIYVLLGILLLIALARDVVSVYNPFAHALFIVFFWPIILYQRLNR